MICRRIICCLAVAIAASSCSPSPEGEAAKPGVVHAESKLAAAIEANKDVIEKIPSHPRSQEVVDLLLQAAADDGLAQGGDAREPLLARFPDENVGLYLLDQKCRELARESPTAVLDYCRELRGRYPDNAIGAMAFNKELDGALAVAPDQFLARCEESIGLEEPNKLTRVALFRRADYFQKDGRPKPAALDFLRFWALFPQSVDEMNLRSVIFANLNKAGFVFEADLLSATGDPAGAAASIWEEFRPFGAPGGEGEAANRTLSPGEAYFRYSPDADRIQASIDPGQEAGFAKTLLLARLGRLALNAGDAARTLETYLAYAEDARSLAGQQDATMETLNRLAEVNHAVLEESLKVIAATNVESNFIRTLRGLASEGKIQASPDQLLHALRTVQAETAGAIAEQAADQGPEAYAREIDKVAEAYKTGNDRKSVIAAYQKFIDRFPESELAPRTMLKMADFYREAWGSLGMAADICKQLTERYPNSPETPLARMRQGLFLYENERYQEALDAFAEFEKAYKERPETPLVRLLSALCESSLGQRELSERHLEDIIAQYPDTDVAPRALFFLGNNKLARQEYAEARECFLDLVDQYPSSPYVAQAREYADRLGQIEAKKAASPPN